MQSDALPLSRLVAAIVVLCSVAAVGFVGFWPADTADDPHQPIGQNASDRLAELDGLSATVETTMVLGNETNRTVQRVWNRPGTRQLRAKTIGDGPTTLTVSNGSVYWIYRPAENNVTRLDVSGYDAVGQRRGERIERIFTRLNVTRETRDEPASASITPGSAPLPAVPGGQSVSTPAPTPAVDSTDEFGVRYNGTATVSGREVYVISIRTAGTGNATVLEDYERTLYVDSEYFFPLKTHTEWRSDGERFSTTTVYRNVSFNPGINDSRFRFDPPEDATIVETNTPAVASYDSLSAARSNTSLPVPDPDVPASFSLEGVQVISGNFSSVSVRYANETARLSATVTDVANTTNATDGERLTVDGREVVYRQIGPSHYVAWECGGYRFSVSATTIRKDRLVEIAGSVDCS